VFTEASTAHPIKPDHFGTGGRMQRAQSGLAGTFGQPAGSA
jgi:hypothetical protein